MEKYDIISVVGEGSYGLVMRCRHRESGQYVAIKKFLETEDDPTVRKMAMREIRMLKKLRHDNLVNMLEVFRRKKRFFIVFEYLEHTILEEMEARAGGLGLVTSRKYCYQVLRAIDFIHSHNVIHRDIKPENVLVSRLGVIKLCDFGFARPFAENETFTDYVATRWYRSPELLTGDPRYGKEVDIWAIGCLFAEMMTGEPLFPGESDIDQLFQIIRVIGKLNARHQILVTRNAMFKGMKQEQNTSLHQMFPDWNRDCLDFLQQSLKMDGNQRPATVKLLRHDLFTRDNFVDTFLVELRTKLAQEMQGNPLLKRMPSNGGSSGRSDTKKSGEAKNKTSVNDKFVTDGSTTNPIKIGLSLAPPQFSSKHNDSEQRRFSNVAQNGEEISLNITSLRHYLNNHQSKHVKPITINNLVFNEKGKNQRGLSAKYLLKTNVNTEKSNFDMQLQPPSPIQFASLQTENVLLSEQLVKQETQLKRLSPPQYFTQKRSSNILCLQQVPHKGGLKPSSVQANPLKTKKRDRPHIDITLMPLCQSEPSKDASPRILPPPPWLTATNLKISTHGKTTQISKRGVTDWKSIEGGGKHTASDLGISHTNHHYTSHHHYPQHNSQTSGTSDFLLPDCPGASCSPYKASGKKKLEPMVGGSVSSELHSHSLNHSNNLVTPRNFSATTDPNNET